MQLDTKEVRNIDVDNKRLVQAAVMFVEWLIITYPENISSDERENNNEESGEPEADV
jgi:hypothetical protein